MSPVLAAGLVAVPTAANAAVPPIPAGYTLVFSDDFTGAAWASPDTGKWQYATGHGYPGGAANWGTGEIETMTANNANAHLVGRPPPRPPGKPMLIDYVAVWTSQS
jgi:hypothetical protein